VATVTAVPVAPASAGRAGVVAQLEAGQAAVGAGAVEAGLQCLRRAVADAAAGGQGDLHVRALVALGGALVHAARGRDEEGATALHAAVRAAGDSMPDVVSEAARELGYVEFLRGRYDRVESWMARAEATAADDAQRAAVLTVRGTALTDVGRYAEGTAALRRALELAPDDRRRSYAGSMLGRAALLRGELDDAAALLDSAFALAVGQGWTSFVPWPESLRAEADLARGDLDQAQERLDHAFALSCQVGDPCWEGLSGRGLGLLRAARGDIDGAVAALRDARSRCTRLPDAYLWVDAYTLEAMCQVGARAGLPAARQWARELSAVAARTGLRELAVRALVHRAALGEPDLLALARAEAEAVDNPVLQQLVAVGPD
jgi:tetratricopeptide (TPR) repeat protein